MANISAVLEKEANRSCFDCDEDCSTDPWSSISHGSVLCLRCAGAHRSLGVHVSFVRSLMLDEIKTAEAAVLLSFGNDAFSEFLVNHGISRRVWKEIPIDLRYHTPGAELYRRRVATVRQRDGTVDGAGASSAELPTDLKPSVRPPQPAATTTPTCVLRDPNPRQPTLRRCACQLPSNP